METGEEIRTRECGKAAMEGEGGREKERRERREGREGGFHDSHSPHKSKHGR